MFKPRLWWLLAFAPVSWVADWVMHNEVLTFVSAAVAIVPLAGLIGSATEQLAIHVGSRLGGLLNATLGNVAELVIGLFLVFEEEFEVLKASLTGSILGNLLLVLGLSFLLGGLKHEEQEYNARAAGTHAASLALAVIGLLMPTLFVGAAPRDTFVEREVVSVVVGVVLIGLYAAALVFTLVTHEHLFHVPTPDEEAAWSKRKAIGVLVAAVGVVALESEILVGALEPTIEELGMTKFFVGLILIPLVGNAAEHSSAILFALRNKADVALEIAVGSSTQIALLVAPVLVLLSLALGHPMDFVFTTFEVVAVAASTFIVWMLSNDGRSNWLEGAQLVGAYLIMSISFFFLR